MVNNWLMNRRVVLLKFVLGGLALLGVVAGVTNPSLVEGEKAILNLYDDALHERAQASGRIEDRVASSVVHLAGPEAMEHGFDVTRDSYVLFSVFRVSPRYIGSLAEGTALSPTFVGAFGTVFPI